MTFGACEWLNRKHTIFGKVTGKTIFNLLRMSEVECDDNDRPLEEIVLKSVEVLWNPFDNIVPRRNLGIAPNFTDLADDKQIKKEKRIGKKNLKLLSFSEAVDLEQDSNMFGMRWQYAHL